MYKAVVKFENPVELQKDLFSNIEQVTEREYAFKKEILKKGHIRWGGMTFRKLQKIVEKKNGLISVEYTPDKARDVAIFIGSSFYPTIDSFVKEAKKLGSCRRIANLPDDVIPGKSKVWLIHDNGYQIKEGEDKRKLEGIGKIFGFFVINRFEAILDNKDNKKELAKNLPVKYLKLTDIRNEPIRGCGYRKPGAYYFVGDKDFDKYFRIAKDYTNKFAIDGDLVLLKYLLSYEGKRFRGVKYTDEIDVIQNFLMAEKLLSGFEIWEKV